MITATKRKQNSTIYPVAFFMASSSDHVTGVTGLTPTVTISKSDGGSWGSALGAVSEKGNGWYELAGNATDRNTLGTNILKADGAGADSAFVYLDIVSDDPFAIASSVWDEVLTGATHNIQSSAGKRLRTIGATVIQSGTVAAATENTISLSDGEGASTVNGAYDPSVITITGGTGYGQSRNILEYVGTTRTCVVDRDWKTRPDTTSLYDIQADAGREHVNEGMAQGGTINTITLNSSASSYDNVYVGQVVFIRSGLGEDQACRVTAYNGTTKVATLAKNWNVIPDSTSAYVMLPTAILDINLFIQNIWSYGTRTLTSFGSLVSDIWSNITRTLTSSGGGSLTAQEVWSYFRRTLTHINDVSELVVTSDSIEVMRGETISIDLSNLGNISDQTNIYFTVKTNYQTLDEDAIIQISSNEGLIVLNGTTSGSSGGSINILDSASGSINIYLKDDESIKLQKSPSLRFDVKVIRGDESNYVSRGEFIIKDNVTNAII